MTANLKLLALAQFREKRVENLVENYTVTWSKNGQVVSQLADQTSISFASEPGEKWQVAVKLTSSQVKTDNGVLSATKSWLC